MPPEVGRIQRHDGADQCIAVGQSARIAGRERRVHQWIQQVAVDVDRLGRVGAQRTVGILSAVGCVVVECLLECLGLVDVGLDRIGVGIDRTVEDHRPHIAGESLGVGGPDPGAVGVAQVVQFVIADRRAQRVKVLGDTRGANIGQEIWAHLIDATLHEGLRLTLDSPHTVGAVVHHRIGPQTVVVGIGVAPHRRSGRADPARVEAHQVEPLAHVGRQSLDDAGGGLDTGFPRPARVDDQRTNLLAGGRKPDQRQDGLVAVGLVVVDGDRDLAALGAGRNGYRLAATATGRPARPPLHRLSDLRCRQHRGTRHHGRATARREQDGNSRKHHGGAGDAGAL